MKNKKMLIVLLVLIAACFFVAKIAVATSVQHTIERREALNNSLVEISKAISKSGIEFRNEADKAISEFIIAERVYPHGHTDRRDEHTFAAYDAALDAGAHYVDTDVVVSREGTLYVAHDLSASRIAGVNSYYSSMSDIEIDRLRGRSGEKVLKLSEVMDKYGKSVKYLIELKSADSEIVNAFIDMIKNYDMADYVILQSEFPEVLDEIEDSYPNIPKLLVVKNDMALSLAMTSDYIDIVGARVQYMTESNCSKAHEAGKKFVGWPIDSEEEIHNAIDIGADAYFTNDTALALELERKYRPFKIKDHSTILFASDYQAERGFDTPKETLEKLLKSVSADNKEPDTAIICGDYTNDAMLHDYQLSPEESIGEIKGTIRDAMPQIANNKMLFVQGNHDAMTESIAKSGLHEYNDYLVYVLNTENDFPWKQGKVKGSYDKVKGASEEMKKCFDKLIEKGETRPIFIAGHVPLHYTARTSSRHSTGDNLYASLIFDVVNEAANSLDIFYMYGHNHSKGWDCYMGGASVFKTEGDSLLLPIFSDGTVNTDTYEEKQLNFTYMNAGYTGYYMNCSSGQDRSDYKATDESLTCTVCEVYPDRIEIRRYDEEGMHILGAEGKGNPYKNGIDDGLIDSKYYSKQTAGPVVIQRKGALHNNKNDDNVNEKQAA